MKSDVIDAGVHLAVNIGINKVFLAKLPSRRMSRTTSSFFLMSMAKFLSCASNHPTVVGGRVLEDCRTRLLG